MKKILTVLGARPQFIKAAVVSRNLLSVESIEEIIIHTGQHYDVNMSDVFFEEMNIPKPDYNLNINGLGHGAMTGQMLEKIEVLLIKENPDLVLVYGDTNSTLAGALAAKKLNIQLVHVEAGLRSFNMRMPEEINRVLTDRISDLLFCPTDTAVKNLYKEGYDHLEGSVSKVGDVMFDASKYYVDKAKKPMSDFPKEFVLATIHRGENTDDPINLRNIFDGLELIAQETNVVMPLHPRTRKKLNEINYAFEASPITFLEPVGYFEMIYLLINCKLVITDSGGLQKEAFFFGKHCLVTRNETEWVELVFGGYNFLCGSDPDELINRFKFLKELQNVNFDVPLYGNGDAGKLIVKHILSYLNGK